MLKENLNIINVSWDDAEIVVNQRTLPAFTGPDDDDDEYLFSSERYI